MAAADVSHNTDGGGGRERLEEVPGGIVQEEDALQRNDGSKEEAMRHGSGAESLGGVGDVGTQHGPGAEEDGQGCNDGGGEDEGDNLGRVARVVLEDVVDLCLLAVANGRVGEGEGHVGVALDVEVEDLRLVGGGGAEGTDDERGLDRGGAGEELDGEVLVRLSRWRQRVVVPRDVGETYQLDLALAVVLNAQGERVLQTSGRLGEGQESLVRALGLLAFDGGEDDLQSVLGAQNDGLLKRRLGAEPVGALY